MAYQRRWHERGRHDRGWEDRGRPERGWRDRTRHDRGRRDRGQAALEYLGFVPILMIVAMAVVQIGLIAYTAQQAGTAARAGARAASLRMGAQAGCQEAVADWLAGRTSCGEAPGGDTVTVTATVTIPSVVPGWDFGPARKRATMPLDH
ncbi:TadE/TadG family type IV pilus assembly protein [Streptomyces sp. NPDC096152]|uniref:TadE/TadG family type IV pilus assembly protein n=1 Tax=Streptomyces sp. NPDC096152 TaxID=3366078 RepID=UPI0037F492C4